MAISLTPDQTAAHKQFTDAVATVTDAEMTDLSAQNALFSAQQQAQISCRANLLAHRQALAAANGFIQSLGINMPAQPPGPPTKGK